MEPLNRAALGLVDEAIDVSDELGVGVVELDCGATVIDFGIDVPGGTEAGVLFAELQTGGLASVAVTLDRLGDGTIPAVELRTDQPAIALLAAQHAGWTIEDDAFSGLASGPARALAADDHMFDVLDYREDFEFAVLCIETDRLPTDAVAAEVADRVGINEEAVFLATAPTGSVAGSVAGASRAAELAMTRLVSVGYDPAAVRTAYGTAPVPPATADESRGVARSGDALFFGGRAHLVVEDDPAGEDPLASTAADRIGQPTYDAAPAFEELPGDVFAPASVTVDVIDGPTITEGAVDEDLLRESFDR